ncbi:uncharacterized protein LOC129748379 [Uranotaenia lowii]|uniref:uncharacterized protein LOC129748379 n=1 Tax=Uranotaenia lowii TaxID=190385 RepID=UPI00247A8653|nr:uncharacterized protein LOC129748379 [Uranotaenia lowii]
MTLKLFLLLTTAVLISAKTTTQSRKYDAIDPRIIHLLESSPTDDDGRIGTVRLDGQSWDVHTTLEVAKDLLQKGIGTRVLTRGCNYMSSECYWPPRNANYIGNFILLGTWGQGTEKAGKKIYDLQDYEAYLEHLKRNKLQE